MKNVVAIIFLLVLSASASASGVKNAKIAMVETDSNGPKYVFFSGGTFTDTRTCVYPVSTQGYTLFRISDTAKAGDAIYATALAAMTAGLTVELIGSGVCEAGYETLRYILVQQATGFTY